MVRLVLLQVVIVWLAVSGGAALAQTQPPDLTVTLRDAAGAPVAGVTAIVRDASGAHDLARAPTDDQGVAAFAGLTERQVRVAIVGRLPHGTALYQPGDDRAGIRLLLAPAPATLDLRCAADGMVVPDPAAMAREPGIPIATAAAPIPRAPIAPTIAIAQVVVPPPAATQPLVGTTALDAAAVESGQIWFGLALLALLIGAGVGIAMIQRRAQ